MIAAEDRPTHLRFLLAATLLAILVGPARADAPKLDAAALKQAKRATVYLQVKLPDGSTVQGSGFLGVEPGLVVTNAHVLGMLDPDGRLPLRVDVTLNSGESDSRTLVGKVLGVDRGSDLGVLRIEGKDLPEPLKVGSAKNLTETQEVYIFGFPFGKELGKNITVSKTSVSSLRKVAGVIRQVQVNGGMHPGNSGGPVTDADGQVIGVAVSGLTGTQIHFAVAADYVHTFLNGRMASFGFEQPIKDGDQVKLPVKFELIDPLGRLRKVVAECWTGDPGLPRPVSATEPKPLPGDSDKQSFTIEYDKKGIARGEITLPALSARKTYWIRPVVTNGAGETRWYGAAPQNVGIPVERTAVTLKFKPAAGARRNVELTSQASLRVRDRDDEFTVALTLRSALAEQIAKESASRRRLECARFALVVQIDGKPITDDEELQLIAKDARLMAAELETDEEGNVTKSLPDLTKLPRASREPVEGVVEQTLRSLEALSVPLPGKKVEPGQSWTAERVLWVGPPASAVPARAEMKYTYVGVRKRDGKEEALVYLGGTVRGRKDEGLNLGGRVSGLAWIAVATGEVLSASTDVKVDLDLTFRRRNVKATGSLAVQLKREAASEK
ncbi:MAG TPA: trypsin-like peptidase domain-containing protein [Gemmataceae bacterium]|nr:trypsin-like peptidase domain-containing protein [Gemmataceae bacterium]